MSSRHNNPLLALSRRSFLLKVGTPVALAALAGCTPPSLWPALRSMGR